MAPPSLWSAARVRRQIAYRNASAIRATTPAQSPGFSCWNSRTEPYQGLPVDRWVDLLGDWLTDLGVETA